MAIRALVSVDQAANIRMGRAVGASAVVTLESSELESWPQEIRDLLAVSLKSEGEKTTLHELYGSGQRSGHTLTVTDPTPAGVRAKLEALNAEIAKEREKAAAEDAKHAAEDARLAAAPLDECLEFSLYRRDDAKWQPRHLVSSFYEQKYPLTKARIANELQPECDRRNAELAKQRDAEKAAREKAEADKLESLRRWALEHGSELTKARLAEGFDSWQKSAADDRAKLVNDYADAIVNAIPVERDEEPTSDDYDSEDRLSPTLAEIEALRIARANAPSGVSCKLIRETYTTNADKDDEDSAEVKEYRTALELDIQHEFGKVYRAIVLKS